MSIKRNKLTAFLAKNYFDFHNSGLERLIFTATTGRSGTLTLAKLFSLIPNCIALHEPYPIMNGKVLTAASYDDLRYIDRVYRMKKAINIRRAAAGYRYYMESNHLFIKSFIQQAVNDFGDRISVIHLIRPSLEVAMSIYRLQECPGTENGNHWWLDYRAPSNRIKIVDLLEDHKEFSHPFYKALWYWFEVEARIFEWQNRIPSLHFVRFETGWLNDKYRISELLDSLNIEYQKEEIAYWQGNKENVRDHQKFIRALSVENSRYMLERFLEMLIQRGYSACLPMFALNITLK